MKQPTHEQSLLRIGSVSAMSGALLGVVFNLLHPRLPSDPEAILRVIAGHPHWRAIHLGIMLAGLLLLGGQVALSSSIRRAPGAAWAQLGLVAAVAGGVVMVVSITIDGFAMKALADAWADAPGSGKEGALQIASAIELTQTGLFFAWICLFCGLPFVFYGLAIALSGPYPALVGWAGFVGGLASLAIGVTKFLTAASTVGELFYGTALLLSVWMFIVGILMWRRAVEAMPAAEERAHTL